MDQTKTTLERAFELAKSGKVASVTHLRAQIKSEGYAQQQIDGRALGRQLRDMIARARSGLPEKARMLKRWLPTAVDATTSPPR